MRPQQPNPRYLPRGGFPDFKQLHLPDLSESKFQNSNELIVIMTLCFSSIIVSDTPERIKAHLEAYPTMNLNLLNYRSTIFASIFFRISNQAWPRGWEILEILLSDDRWRPDVNGRCGKRISYYTPMHFIAHRLNFVSSVEALRVARQFISYGANVDLMGLGGVRPIHLACSSVRSDPNNNGLSLSNVDMVRLLLDHGANVDQVDEDFRSPLFIAASLGDVEVVTLLLQRGADPTIRAKGNASGFYYWKDKKSQRCFCVGGCDHDHRCTFGDGSRSREVVVDEPTASLFSYSIGS